MVTNGEGNRIRKRPAESYKSIAWTLVVMELSKRLALIM